MTESSPLAALGRVLAEVSAANQQQMEVFRLQVAQQSQILQALVDRAGVAPTTSAAVSVHRMSEAEDPQAFLAMFEATAVACAWPEEEWGGGCCRCWPGRHSERRSACRRDPRFGFEI